ncbi:MAG: hypothetical protein KF800_17010 [Lysobacter sp.]|nr:hypothetical protein [Lysobacter sp.]
MEKQMPMWQIVLRWLAFLPGALLAALLVSALMRLLNRLSMFLSGMNPDGFLNKLWLEVIASALMGAAFVYAGSRIAPMHRKPIGYTLTVTIILLAGFLAFPAITQQNWWALIGCIAMAAGGAVVAHSVATGELDLDTHTLT